MNQVDLPIASVDFQLFPIYKTPLLFRVGRTAATAGLAGSSLMRATSVLKALVMKNDVFGRLGNRQRAKTTQRRGDFKSVDK